MRRLPTVLALVLVPVLAAACGDDESSSDGDAQPYVEALSAELAKGEGLPVDEAQAECVATTLVEAAGPEQLEEEGISPEELAAADGLGDLEIEVDDERSEALADDLIDCDLATVLVAAITSQVGSELPDEARDCVVERLNDDGDFAAALAAGFTGEGDQTGLQSAAGSALAACPDAGTALLVAGMEAQAGTELSAEAVACVRDQVEANAEEAAALFSGSEDGAAFGQAVGEACQAEIGG